MSSLQFDSNAWYSVQNQGNNYYLGCNSIDICGADTTDQTNFEWFQITKVSDDAPYYIRPKAKEADESGQPFCINIETGQPSLALCNNLSATWGIGSWNESGAGSGLFFYDIQDGESKRLFLNNGGSWSLSEYNGASTTNLNQMQWNVASLGAINNQTYSTAPAVIASAGTIATTSDSASSTNPTSSHLTPVSGLTPIPHSSSVLTPVSGLTPIMQTSTSNPSETTLSGTASMGSTTGASSASTRSSSSASSTASSSSAEKPLPKMFILTTVSVALLLQLTA